MNSSQFNRVRVGGVPEHFNLPWHLAIEDGAFQGGDNGCPEIQFTDYPGGTGAMAAALESNEIDLALLLFEGAVGHILGNRSASELKIFKIYVQSPLTWGIHTGSESSLEHIDDARGKKYAISRFGSGSHLIAKVDARQRGWHLSDEQFVVVGNLDGAQDALTQRTADVFLWERFTTQPLVDAGVFRRLGQCTVPWPAFVVAGKQSFLDANQDVVRKVLDTVDDHATKLKDDSKAIEIISSRYGIRTEDVSSWFKTVQWDGGYRCPRAAVKTIIDALAEVKSIAEVPDLDASIKHCWYAGTESSGSTSKFSSGVHSEADRHATEHPRNQAK